MNCELLYSSFDDHEVEGIFTAGSDNPLIDDFPTFEMLGGGSRHSCQSMMELQPREQYLAGYLSLALTDCATTRPLDPILHISDFLLQLTVVNLHSLSLQ